MPCGAGCGGNRNTPPPQVVPCPNYSPRYPPAAAADPYLQYEFGSSTFRDQNPMDFARNLPDESLEHNISPIQPMEMSAEVATPPPDSPKSPRQESEREESLMQWFDRSVEKELRKHKDSAVGTAMGLPSSPMIDLEEELPLNFSAGLLDRISEANASQVEMVFDLRKEPETDLSDAVDKLAKAEAMCAFAGAVRAAEAAAHQAPPELVEEAALASARGYQTDLKATSIQGEIVGVRPIEVLGYVGVTKPKYPTKRRQ
ncbi:unnamed protein product [Ceutorhynchus assimilis]|uniref:Uncharacterized protein n=1 Tax=Ceutorhynchus assimilis TaxID=467358 RepID=A0A9N9MLL1_9CUCU|nr:unnamed protein product [Ceutorhynchus assimilis]